MTSIVERFEEKIVIRHFTRRFENFTFTIGLDDDFLNKFCKKDMKKMENILKNGNVLIREGQFIFTVEDPVHLEYILQKDPDEDFRTMQRIIENINIFEEENKILKDRLKKMEDVIVHMNDRIGDGIFLPGYSNGIIDKNCTQLRLINSLTFYIHNGYKGNTFVGSSIQPLTKLPNLEELIFENYNGFDFDLTPLKDCKKLKKIYFFNCFHYTLPNFGRRIVETIEENKEIFTISR